MCTSRNAPASFLWQIIIMSKVNSIILNLGTLNTYCWTLDPRPSKWHSLKLGSKQMYFSKVSQVLLMNSQHWNSSENCQIALTTITCVALQPTVKERKRLCAHTPVRVPIISSYIRDQSNRDNMTVSLVLLAFSSHSLTICISSVSWLFMSFPHFLFIE